ncbi:hypothetical protein NPIL_205171 [Nephila pilipes]|uniref:Uncharacterized protein n=1 Tax=Nephila pilipes TaxID=299642 RepID=A0A8X6K7K0_NEPPI|nr:hypothetical protein NPIL_205171 [Nephila pilipes]
MNPGSGGRHSLIELEILGKEDCFTPLELLWHGGSRKNHSDDCYFCSCHVRGYNRKNQNLISYPDKITSVIHPVPYGLNVTVPLPPTELPVIPSESSDSDHPRSRL